MMNIFKTIKEDLTDTDALSAVKQAWKSYAFWLLAGALAGWVYCQSMVMPDPGYLDMLVLWLFSTLLAAIALADFKTFIVPDILVYPLALLALLYLPQNPVVMGFGAVILGLMFLLVKLLGEKAMGKAALGWGDVKLVTALGLWVGVMGIVPFLLTASLSAVVVVFGLRIRSKANPLIPFAPFLAFGGWVAYSYGYYINTWLIEFRQQLLGSF